MFLVVRYQNAFGPSSPRIGWNHGWHGPRLAIVVFHSVVWPYLAESEPLWMIEQAFGERVIATTILYVPARSDGWWRNDLARGYLCAQYIYK